MSRKPRKPRRSREDMTTRSQVNRDMNPATFTLRRKVISIIFEAKNLLREQNVEMDRVDIRITDSKEHQTLGVARMNDRIMWIPADSITNLTGLELRHVVFHELCHALFGTKHDELCMLMSRVLRKTTRKDQNNAFLTNAIIR